MATQAMDLSKRWGQFATTAIGGERVRAYVPPPLPPDPPLQLDSLLGLIEGANRALGRLDGVASILPDAPLFLYMYVRKEALLSSQIEGTQSSLSDLLLYENARAPGAPLDDVREVSSYVQAMDHGLERLRGGFPLSLRLIREIHRILLVQPEGRRRIPVNFAAARIGLAAPAPALRSTCRHRPTLCQRPWAISKPSCTTTRRRSRR